MCTNIPNRVLSWFDFFTAYYNCLNKNVKKLISPRVCAQVSQIVFLADLTVLRIISTVWEKKFTKLISPRVLCTSVTNRVLTWFDRFMAKYNIMIENVAKIISPRVVCTNITNRVLSWFDRLMAYYYCMSKKFKKTHISTSSVHNYHKSCF